ncbi:hypothetical protein CDAR_472171 [Caerostris darwini]|uniref:Uncharacterized protein n=1 Tax=Caerostris darwini TaxID=1538125 RepID=A0AAV4VNH7_9ARAC|nr:hypothetical protein CDAR_472171 [Caerostris darwini]
MDKLTKDVKEVFFFKGWSSEVDSPASAADDLGEGWYLWRGGDESFAPSVRIDAVGARRWKPSYCAWGRKAWALFPDRTLWVQGPSSTIDWEIACTNRVGLSQGSWSVEGKIEYIRTEQQTTGAIFGDGMMISGGRYGIGWGGGHGNRKALTRSKTVLLD